jgi:Tfp pilus assembly protein PilO
MLSIDTKRLNQHAFPVLVVSAAAFVAVISLRAGALPLLDRLAGRRELLARYTDYVSREGGYEKIRRTIAEKHSLLNEKLSALSQNLSDSKELSSLLKVLITRAKDAGIEFVKMEPQPESKESGYVRYPVLLELTTSYRSLVMFLASLERLPHVVQIDRLAVTARADGSLHAKILVVCFLRPEA